MKKYRVKYLYWVWLLLIGWGAVALPGIAHALKLQSQVELNGFYIGQHISVLENEFKSFYQTSEVPPYKYRFYTLDKKTNSTIAFIFVDEWKKKHIHGIQITGNPKIQKQPFYGLKLGVTRNKLEARLGRASEVRPEGNGKTMLNYKKYNFSFMVNGKGGKGIVYSLRIMGFRGFPDRDPGTIPDQLLAFKNAVLKEDKQALLNLLMPDVEVFKGGKVYRVRHRFGRELTTRGSHIARELFNGPESLKAFFQNDKSGFQPGSRLYDNPKTPINFLMKFPESKLMKELVYGYHAGEFKVWEIRFREP